MNVLQTAIIRMLRPLVRMLLRQGMTFDEFAEVGKRVYIDVADQEFRLPGRKQTIARISMLTGIQRKEVSRLQKIAMQGDQNLDSAYNRGVRVTSGWRRDARFCAADGTARALPFEGKNSFSELVKQFSGDLPARAVLDEFIRIGVVERDDKGAIVLCNEAGFVPSASEIDQINIVGQASADLLHTLAHNTDPQTRDTRLQLTVAYNNLSARTVDAFKALSQKDGFALIQQFDEWLSSRDRDASPGVDYAPADIEQDRFRAGVGIYFFQEPFSAEVQ